MSFDYYFMLNLLKIILLDAHLFTNDIKTKECNTSNIKKKEIKINIYFIKLFIYNIYKIYKNI